jgi:hypothetical protein
MDRSPICGPRHQPVEHVEFADEMTLSHAADRRVARHLPGVLRPKREQAHARAPARSSSSSLAPGMAGADHQYVVHDQLLADPRFTWNTSLLAEAKTPEQSVEYVFNAGPSGQAIKCCPSLSEALRHNHDVTTACAQRIDRLRDVPRLPSIERDRFFPG